MMKMDILAESAARITVLAFGVVVFLRALNIRSPRVAHRVWTAVVVVMLLLPIFVAWGPEFAVPLLSSDAASTLRLPAADASRRRHQMRFRSKVLSTQIVRPGASLGRLQPALCTWRG